MSGLGDARRLGRFSPLPLALLAGTALAGTGGGVPTAISSSPVSPSGMFQVLLGLVMVLAAIWATAWLLRRFVPGQSGAGGVLRVIGGVMVGPKERVVLVELGETWLVLGVASGQVSTLHSMPRPEGQVAGPGAGEGKAGFAAWLHRARQGRGNDE